MLCCAMRSSASRLRARIPRLTYFEYGTLAAAIVFDEAAVEVAILEVGLGGPTRRGECLRRGLRPWSRVSISITWTIWARTAKRSDARKAGIFRGGASGDLRRYRPSRYAGFSTRSTSVRGCFRIAARFRLHGRPASVGILGTARESRHSFASTGVARGASARECRGP